MSSAELNKVNHLISIEDDVDRLGTDLATLLNGNIERRHIVHLFQCLYDDLKPVVLEWELPYGASASGYLDKTLRGLSGIPDSKINSTPWQTAQKRLAEEKDKVVENLKRRFPFKTWGYVYVKQLSNSILIEEVGDRRVDEWQTLTADGRIPLDFLQRAIRNEIEKEVNSGRIRVIDTDQTDTEALLYNFAKEYNQ